MMAHPAVPDPMMDSGFEPSPRGQKPHGKRPRKPYPHQTRPGELSGQSPDHACYNCGAYDHSVQHCPERRSDGYSYPHPSKRQKTGGSADSHYRGNSSRRGRVRPQRGSTHYSHSDYRHMPDHMSHGHHGYYPPGPHDSWQSGPPSPYGYHPYGPPPEPPYPSKGYGPSYGPRGAHGPMHGPPEYHHHHPYPHYPERDYPPYPPDLRHPPPRDTHRGPPGDYWDRFDHIRPVAPPVEPWTDEAEFAALGDGKPDPNHIGKWNRRDSYRDQSSPSAPVWRAPRAVARPLPSILTDRDEMTMPPPLSSLPRGMCVSKYILDKKNLELICNIRDTEDWPFVMDDPMFKTLELDGEFITIKELLAIRAKVYETHRIEREPTPEFVENYDENEGEENLEDNDLRANEADNHLEASYSDGSYERQDDDSRSYTSFHDDQDRPQSPVFDEDAEADRKARASSRQDYSRSPSPASYKVEIDHHDQALNGEQPSDQQDHLQNGSNEPDDRTWPSHRNGLENGGPGVNRRTDWNYSGKGRRFDHRKNDPEFRRGRYQQQYPPPPPPPVNGTPVQARNGDKKDHSSNHHSPADTSENGHQHSDEVKLEPSADNSKENRADASAQRSRHKRTRAEDSDSGDEPRRQVDDVTPRMKRRQPQVAAAYSRRW